MTNSNVSPFAVGNNVFLLGSTNYFIGKVVAIGDDEVVLSDCSWVADVVMDEALQHGKLRESRYLGVTCSVPRGTVSVVFPWNHPLPTKSI